MKPEALIRLSPHLLTVGAFLIGCGVAIGLLPDNAQATRSKPSLVEPTAGMQPVTVDTAPSGIGDNAGPAEGSIAPIQPVIATKGEEWITETVQRGDNLSKIFDRRGLSARDLDEIMSLGKETASLKKISPGAEIRFQIGDDGRLNTLAYPIGDVRELRVDRSDNGFSATVIERELERRVVEASGEIHDSLFVAANRAGLSDRLIMELASIFGCDIDFSLDIREHDRFAVIYEQLVSKGQKLRDGRILAAEFVNRGQPFRAVLYVDPATGAAAYYSPDGKNLRKAFLRSPVAFTRVSSGFSLGRYHPILNLIRAHKGVDYAAPVGTPVKSTGDGKITFKGSNGGYGKTIVIQHGSRYSTLYGHLSAFAHVGVGQRVRQGQVIGYVGMTGLATGPHLHYEFRVDGVHRNPLTVKLPDAAPIPKQRLASFRDHTRPLLARLDALDRAPALAGRELIEHAVALSTSR
jgi:murein DD-endopeptidase MepM/ murein hydrolase activator NlpD